MNMVPFFNILTSLVWVLTVLAYKPAFFFLRPVKEMASLECSVEVLSLAFWEVWDGMPLRMLAVVLGQTFLLAGQVKGPSLLKERKLGECLSLLQVCFLS
jgi:hypothetical protein